MTTNRTINDLTAFQLPPDKFKSSLNEKPSSFKQSFFAEVLQFKNDVLQKQATNTVINLLLDTLI